MNKKYPSKSFPKPLNRILQIVLGFCVFISFCVYSQQSIITVNAGWNLLGNGISYPITLATTGTKSLADPLYVKSVWKWNASLSKWAFYSPSTALSDGGASYAKQNGFDFLTKINPGDGFWVNAIQPFSITLPTGSIVRSATFQQGSPGALLSGWNLISIGDGVTPSQFNTNMGNSPPTAGTITPNITSLWAWNNTNSNWIFYSPLTAGTTNADSNNGYASFGTSTLGMGVGFWVNNPSSSSSSSSTSSTSSTSGSGSTTTSTSSTPITVSGKVIDGYISGALVCADLNKNGKCDKTEPSTTSDSAGNYTLSLPPSVPNMHLIAVINASTSKDQDDGGSTIFSAGGKSYTLLAPAPTSDSSNTHITPLTTLVSGLMATSGLSAQAAQSQVLVNFSQPPTLPLLNYDFTVSGSNPGSTQSQKLAKIIVSAIASAQNTLTSSSSYTQSADSDQAGYTAITQIIPSALNTIIDPDGGNLKTAVSTLSSAVASVGDTSKQIASSIASSVAVSAQTLGSTKSIATASSITNGFVTFQNSNGDTYSNTSSMYNQINTSGIRAGYNRLLNGIPVSSSYDLVNNVWYLNTQDGTNYDLTNSGWLPEPKSNGVSPTNFQVKNNCFSQDMTTSGPTQRVCLNASDVSSQLVAKLIPTVCSDGTPLANCSTATFPANSYTYDVNFSYLDDRYEVWVNDGHASLCGSLPSSVCSIGWNGYGYYSAGNTNYNDTNLVDYFTHLASNKTVQYIGNNSNVAIQINSFNSSTQSGVIAFYDNSSQAISNLSNASASISQFTAETATFKIQNINGTPIAIYTNPVVFSKNNPDDHEPYGIFAAVTRQTDNTTGIWQGGYTPAHYQQNVSFSGVFKVASKNVLDTYLTLTQQAAFPDK
jgi:hypothetical protein